MSPTESALRAYEVLGMTCSHCLEGVAEEVSRVPGVDGVELDLHSGRLGVRGAGIDDDSIRAAVEEAGYSLAGASA